MSEIHLAHFYSLGNLTLKERFFQELSFLNCYLFTYLIFVALHNLLSQN